VEQVTRRDLLVSGGKYAALAAGAVPFAGGLAHLARGGTRGIFVVLALLFRGAVVVRGVAAF
jgi:hypothetical protein